MPHAIWAADHEGLRCRFLVPDARLHAGQPEGLRVLVRWSILAAQVYGCSCLLQIHCTILFELTATSSGFSMPLPVVSQSAAISGCRALRELHAQGRLPLQKGHPVPFLCPVSDHSLPFVGVAAGTGCALPPKMPCWSQSSCQRVLCCRF